jgi:hypothetical protein
MREHKMPRFVMVIIDVFRAFSLLCYVYANGADHIFGWNVEKHLKMKK